MVSIPALVLFLACCDATFHTVNPPASGCDDGAWVWVQASQDYCCHRQGHICSTGVDIPAGPAGVDTSLVSGCCQAQAAGCLACKEKVTVQWYCANHQDTPGCGCCLDDTAQCYACQENMPVAEYCVGHSEMPGCAGCCQEHHAECWACQNHLTVTEYCQGNQHAPGCGHLSWFPKLSTGQVLGNLTIFIFFASVISLFMCLVAMCIASRVSSCKFYPGACCRHCPGLREVITGAGVEWAEPAPLQQQQHMPGQRNIALQPPEDYNGQMQQGRSHERDRYHPGFSQQMRDDPSYQGYPQQMSAQDPYHGYPQQMQQHPDGSYQGQPQQMPPYDRYHRQPQQMMMMSDRDRGQSRGMGAMMPGMFDGRHDGTPAGRS